MAVFFSQKGLVLMRRNRIQITVGRNRVLLTIYIYTHITFSNVELYFLNATIILALYDFINSFSIRNTSTYNINWLFTMESIYMGITNMWSHDLVSTLNI